MMALQKQQSLLPDINDPSKKKKRNWNTGVAHKALQHYQEKYGKAPSDLLSMRPKTKEEYRTEQDQELEDLFDSIVDEIEDRQVYLDQIQKIGGQKEVEKRMKSEIVERIAELQKIREIQNKE